MIFRLLNKKLLTLFLTVAIISSCKDLDVVPADRYTEDNFWTVNANVSNALNTVYNRIENSQRYFYFEAMSDNGYAQLGVNVGTPDNIASGSDALFDPSLPRIRDDWRFYYEGIYSANVFLENVDRNTTLDAALITRMKAEARAIRAFHYFKLINWWGDVPLLKTVISIDEAKVITRAPKAEVLAFILAELDAAIADLPKKEDYAAADKGRITKAAAKAIKARVLLYEGNRMADVVAICEDLMNNQAVNGSYSLVTASAPPHYPTPYSNVFSPSNEYNSEVIMDLGYVINARTHDQLGRFIPISAGGNSENYLAPTQELVDSYIMTNGKSIKEAGSMYDETDPYANRDPRLKATIVYHNYVWTNANGTTQIIHTDPRSTPAAGVSTTNVLGSGVSRTPTGYFYRKYFDNTKVDQASNLNLILIRWAEVLLMYAEAKDALGQMDETVWNNTIRPLRVRAGFTESTALDYDAVIANTTVSMRDIIRNERRVEFVLEGELRLDDIRRWKIAETVMNGWIHGAQFSTTGQDNNYVRVANRSFNPAKHYLWPVPTEEIFKVPTLKPQNPNW